MFCFLQSYNYYSINLIFFFWLLHLGDDDGVSTIEVSPDIGPTIKASATSQMEAAIAALSGELNKLRTGRAAPGTLLVVITIC